MPLSLFAQDVPVRADLVTRAYAVFLDDLQEELGKGEPLDQADAVALHQLPKLKRTSRGRAWIRRSGLYGARRSSDIEDMLAGISSLLIVDEEPSEQAKTATARITGVAEQASDDFSEHLSLMTLSSLRAVVETADIAELRAAVNATRRLITLGIKMNHLQQASSSTALGAGLADIEQLDPIWQAIQALSVAALLRPIPTIPEALTEFENATDQALRQLESASARRYGTGEPTR